MNATAIRIDEKELGAATGRLDVTRVTVPRRRQGRVRERNDLLDGLEDCSDARVTLVVAPAGYGKTTLLAQWCDRLGSQAVPVAWYTASRRDRVPAMFLAMLSTALAQAGIGADDRPAFTEGRVREGITLDDLLLQLELAGQRLVVVIDDFERVNEPAIAEIVTRFIEAAPSNVHLVLAARSFPAIPLSTLELDGTLRTIDSFQLRLKRSDIAWMLDLDIDAPEVARVVASTQGWPATAELYRLWRGRSGGRDGKFGGHVAEVHNYLTEQLFSSLPPEQLDLLVDIADREEVTADLVDTMRGRCDGAFLLAQVALAIPSLMGVEAGSGDLIYRLHPLLLDHLRQILARQVPRRAALATAAAQWHVRQGRYADAARIAVELNDPTLLATVVDALRPVHILVAEGATALRIILRELPDHLVATNPRLQLMAALAHMKAGFFRQARSMLEGIRVTTLDYSVAPDGHADWLAVEGNFTELMVLGQLTRCDHAVEERNARMIAAAADDPLIWGSGEVVMMLAHQVRGDLDRAAAAAARARTLYGARDASHYVETQIAGQEVLLLLARGRLRQAAELIGAFQRNPGFELPTDVSAPTLLRLTAAAIRYEQEFSEGAANALAAAFAEHRGAESWFDQYAITYPAITARLFVREGLDAVLLYLAEERVRVERAGIEAAPNFLLLLEIGFRARVSDVDGAAALADAVGLASFGGDGDPIGRVRGWRERDLAAETLSRLHLAQRNPVGALAAALDLARSGARGGRLRAELKGWVMAALAEDAAGRPDRAADALLRALRLAYPERYLTPFAEEGAALSPVIDRVADGADLDGYAQQHVGDVRRAIASAFARADGDQLNKREGEIVEQLALGLSNKMIARRLGITDHTVKFHLKKIFFKLGVSSRRAAVAKVGETG